MRIAAFSKTYGDRMVLRTPELELVKGKIYAVIGPNGSGKSTFAKIVADVLTSDQKIPLITDEEVVRYMPQKSYPFRMSVEKNILLGLKRKAKPFKEAYKMLENCHGTIEIRNLSSEFMSEPDKSVDFVFTDPPFGDYIPYAEVTRLMSFGFKRLQNEAVRSLSALLRTKMLILIEICLQGCFKK